jgi:hypothetical protein
MVAKRKGFILDTSRGDEAVLIYDDPWELMEIDTKTGLLVFRKAKDSDEV